MSTFWAIVTFAYVAVVILWVAYALVRPFTHIHHDHRDVFHPPKLG